MRCRLEEPGQGRVVPGTHHTSTVALADPSAAVAASRIRLPGVRAWGLVSSSPRLGLQGWIISASCGAQCITSRNVTWSSVSSGGGGPVTARAYTLGGQSSALGSTSHPRPARTVQIEEEPRQGALVVQDRAGKGSTVAGLHWPDSCQVPVSPRQITEVGNVPSPDLRDHRAETEQLKCTLTESLAQL